MSEKVAVEILVQKAITLMSGESLYQYEENLRNAARDVVKRKYNLTNDDGAYMAEVYDGASVWSMYKKNESPPHQYIMIEHTRDDNGNFKFGGSMKVKRTTKYEPVGVATKVTKGRWVEEEKAVWTAAFINTLPDAAFAAILPGGKKDKEGKTTPRSLRMLPHHNENVKSPTENSSVDLPHLRNALARLPQAKMSAAMKKTAMAHLEAHAKELLKGGGGATSKACGDKEHPVKKDFWNGVL